jgi:hypothetical protein
MGGRVRLVRVPRGVEKALIGAAMIAATAWGFLYNHILEDEPRPMQLRPLGQLIGGDFGSAPYREFISIEPLVTWTDLGKRAFSGTSSRTIC